MAIRIKRSISLPPDLDAQIRAEAQHDGKTYSAWLTEAAKKELTIRAGLSAVADVEAELGAFTEDEMAAARSWAQRTAGGAEEAAQRPRAA
ncbi:MAG: hypothetical protein ACYCUM_12430 [Solirubrobacteraceae bacterium]